MGSTKKAKAIARHQLCAAQFACATVSYSLHHPHAAVQQKAAGQSNPARGASTRMPKSGGGSAATRTPTGPVRRARIGRIGVASGPAKQETSMNQVTITAEGLSRAAQDAAAFGRTNLEALAQSAQVYFQGTQGLARQAFTVAQDLNTQAVESAKVLAKAKSLKEVTEVQAQFARTAFERAANETTRLQQAALQVFERAL